MKKLIMKTIALVTATAILLPLVPALMPTGAGAVIEDVAKVDIGTGIFAETGNSKSKWEGNVLKVSGVAIIEVTGKAIGEKQIVVDGDATIILNDAEIDCSAKANLTPLNVTGTSVLTLILRGENNVLKGGNLAAGLQVDQSATLIIEEPQTEFLKTLYGSTPGTLNVAGGTSGAGIGGRSAKTNGAVTINGGTINALGGGFGAGIGGGMSGEGGTITINGGTINATGTGGGAGIGGGMAAGGNITIKGGTINAFGGDNSAGIGGGLTGSGGTITIEGGTISAIGGQNGAGIGGGYNGTGGSITIKGNAKVTAIGDKGETDPATYAAGIGDGNGASGASQFTLGSSIAGGNAFVQASSVIVATPTYNSGVLFRDDDVTKGRIGTVYGQVNLAWGLNVEGAEAAKPADGSNPAVEAKPLREVTIPATASLTLPNLTNLTNNGTIYVSGTLEAPTITNNGTIHVSGTLEAPIINNDGTIYDSGVIDFTTLNLGNKIIPINDGADATVTYSASGIDLSAITGTGKTAVTPQMFTGRHKAGAREYIVDEGTGEGSLRAGTNILEVTKVGTFEITFTTLGNVDYVASPTQITRTLTVALAPPPSVPTLPTDGYIAEIGTLLSGTSIGSIDLPSNEYGDWTWDPDVTLDTLGKSNYGLKFVINAANKDKYSNGAPTTVPVDVVQCTPTIIVRVDVDEVANTITFTPELSDAYNPTGDIKLTVGSQEVTQPANNNPLPSITLPLGTFNPTDSIYSAEFAGDTNNQSAASHPKAYGDATLSALQVNKGTLSPVFDPVVFEYTVSVENGVSSITVTATSGDADDIITGVGVHTLTVGDNVIEVKVRSKPGIEKIYKITVTRAQSGSTGGTGGTGGSGGGGGSTKPQDTTDKEYDLPGGGTVNKPPTYNPDGSATLPEGGDIKQPGGVEIDAPPNTHVDKNGDVYLPSDKGAEVTMPEGSIVSAPEGSIIDKDGNIHIPADKTVVVTRPDGSKETLKGPTTLYAPDAKDKWDNPYIDVNNDGWYINDIEFVDIERLMQGVGMSLFEPDSAMTRAMLVMVLWRSQGSPVVYGTSAFDDVPAGKWFTEAVIWAERSGVVKGISVDMFAPDDQVTREQMAAIFHRYAQYIGKDSEDINTAVVLPFEDVPRISEYALKPVLWTTQKGIIRGMPVDGSPESTVFEPKRDATRAQVAAVLHRFLQEIQ